MIRSEDDQRTQNNGVRHQYRELSQLEKDQMVQLKDLGQAILDKLEDLPEGREVSLAKTKVEEAIMWAVKGLTK